MEQCNLCIEKVCILVVHETSRLNGTIVNHRTPDQTRTGNFVIFLDLQWFGNKLVRNFAGPNKLERYCQGLSGLENINSGKHTT